MENSKSKKNLMVLLFFLLAIAFMVVAYFAGQQRQIAKSRAAVEGGGGCMTCTYAGKKQICGDGKCYYCTYNGATPIVVSLSYCTGPSPVPPTSIPPTQASGQVCNWCTNQNQCTSSGCQWKGTSTYCSTPGDGCCDCVAQQPTVKPPTTAPVGINFPTCANIDAKTVNVRGLGNMILSSYSYAGNNLSDKKLKLETYYALSGSNNWQKITPFREDLKAGDGTGTTTGWKSNVPAGNYNVVSSLYAYKDLNNNNVFDSATEQRKICSGNPAIAPNGPGCTVCQIQVNIP